MSMQDSSRRWPTRPPSLTTTRTRTTSPPATRTLWAPLMAQALVLCSLLTACRSSSGSSSSSSAVTGTANSASFHRSLLADARGGAIQSGPDALGAPSYAASAVYNVASQTLHITGTTYGSFWAATTDTVDTSGSSSCFYAVASIDPTNNNAMDWVHSQTMGKALVDEACQNLYLDERNKRLYIAGQTQTGGLLKDLNSGGIGGENQVQMGMILDYQFDEDNSWSELKLVGGRVLEDEAVVYPVAIAGEVGNGDVLYQVSMESYDYARNNLSSTDPSDGTTPVDPVDHYLYGKSYYMSVKGLSTQPDLQYNPLILQKTLKNNAWGGSTMATTNGESVFVSGIITTGNNVYVAGTTKGDGFGTSNVAQDENDFDGFVTKFSPGNGDVPDPSSGGGAGGGATMAYRVAAADTTNDWVHGICTSGDAASKVDAPNYIYITGATGGMITSPDDVAQSGGSKDLADAAAKDNKIRAYLAKINTLTMTLEWAVNLEAVAKAGSTTDDSTAVVRGISCASTSNGDAVYFAGVVENDSVLPASGTSASMGGTDLFVAKVLNDGTLSFVKQMGSAQEDTLAKRGGITTMPNGDAIVVGNTKGAVYRNRQGEDNALGTVADVLAFTVNGQTGDFVFPLDFSGSTLPVPSPPVVVPAPDPVVPPPAQPQPTSAPQQPAAPAPAPAPKPVDAAAPPTPNVHAPQKTTAEQNEASPSNGSGVEKWVILLLFLLGAIVAIFLSVWYVNAHMMPHKEIGTDRGKVLEYLHDFDVEDVDLKHSATGGWHCSYANALAQGINAASTTRGGRGGGSASGDGLLGPDDDSEYNHSFDPLTASSSSSPLESNSVSLFGDHHNNIIETEGITFGGARGSRPRLTLGSSKRLASGNAAGLGGSNTQYDGLMSNASSSWDNRSPPSVGNATSRKNKEQWGRDII